MNLLFLMKMMGEFSFYFILGNYFASVTGGRSIPLLLCFLPALAVALCRYLSEKENKWERLPLVLMLAALPFLHTAVDLGVYLFGCLYALLLVLRRIYYHSHDSAVSNFQRCSCILVLGLPPLCLVTGGIGALQASVPLALVFLGVSVLQMRMLRHDARTLEERSFLWQNLCSVGILVGLGLLASTDAFLHSTKAVASFFYNTVVLSIIRVILYLFLAIAWVFGKFYSLFNHDFVPTLPKEAAQVIAFGLPGMEYEQETAVPMWVQWIIIGALLLLLMAVVGYVLYKLTTRRYQDANQADFYDQRAQLETSTRPPRRELFAPRDPRRAVRHYYLKFLQDAYRHGVAITPDSTTEDISRRAAGFYAPGPLEALRGNYLRARYSPDPVPRELAKQTKELYNEVIHSAPKIEEERK